MKSVFSTVLTYVAIGAAGALGTYIMNVGIYKYNNPVNKAKRKQAFENLKRKIKK